MKSFCTHKWTGELHWQSRLSFPCVHLTKAMLQQRSHVIQHRNKNKELGNVDILSDCKAKHLVSYFTPPQCDLDDQSESSHFSFRETKPK